MYRRVTKIRSFSKNSFADAAVACITMVKMNKQYFQMVLCMLFAWCFAITAEAKVAPPNQVSSIGFEWGETAVDLSLYHEPRKTPRIKKPLRQSYRATVRAGGMKRELQEEAAPISPSRETDVQMIRYGHIRAEFSEGPGDAQVKLAKDAHVHLYSPRVHEPITVRARRLNIRLHTEIVDGNIYICSTITPRKGKPRTARRCLGKDGTGGALHIDSIEPGLMQPENKLYLAVQVGPVRCVVTEDGGLIVCQPEVTPFSVLVGRCLVLQLTGADGTISEKRYPFPNALAHSYFEPTASGGTREIKYEYTPATSEFHEESRTMKPDGTPAVDGAGESTWLLQFSSPSEGTATLRKKHPRAWPSMRPGQSVPFRFERVFEDRK